MRIVIASGKGGTGKSTIAANLGWVLSRSRDVVLVDCDVEEPNLHLFFPSEPTESEVSILFPVIDFERCDFCGACGHFCQYGAIAVLEDNVVIFNDLCHSCGGCSIVCPRDAINEVPRIVGKVWNAQIDPHLNLITGVLNEGEPNAIPVIKAAKRMSGGYPLVILDSSPGTACPVIETMEEADFVVLVTESTPFGLHDLDLAVQVVEKLHLTAGVIINQSDGVDGETETFCSERGLPILMKVPFDREIAEVQNRGELFSAPLPEWQNRFGDLYSTIIDLVGGA